MTFKDKLIELGACKEAIEWVGDKTLQESWGTCPRGDWMLWLHAKLFPEKVRERVACAAECVATVSHLLTDKRSLNAIKVARRFWRGEATERELRDARADAWDDAWAAAAAWVADAAYAAADVRTQNQQQTADICRSLLSVY